MSILACKKLSLPLLLGALGMVCATTASFAGDPTKPTVCVTFKSKDGTAFPRSFTEIIVYMGSPVPPGSSNGWDVLAIGNRPGAVCSDCAPIFCPISEQSPVHVQGHVQNDDGDYRFVCVDSSPPSQYSQIDVTVTVDEEGNGSTTCQPFTYTK